MMESVLRDASEDDCVAILALNDAEVQHTSPMDMEQLQALAGIASYHNVEPPNPASQRFHDMFGFNEVGRRWAVPGTKLVSMQAAEV